MDNVLMKREIIYSYLKKYMMFDEKVRIYNVYKRRE